MQLRHTLLSSFFIFAVLLFAAPVFAFETDGTIVTGGNNGYAWSNQAGWINFGVASGNIHITDAGITGYAWNANYGWINMAPTNGGITVAANGVLSGYAWGSSLGWINFSGVSINQSGVFTGSATGTGIGTLTFGCANCSVMTDFRPQNFRSVNSSTNNDDNGNNDNDKKKKKKTTQTTAPPTSTTDLDTSTFPPGGEDSLLPAQLFDIRLLVDNANISRIVDLVARVTFESFGRVPTPVALTFTIFDDAGNEIWNAEDTVTVETERVFVKRFFDSPELSPGAYTLRLHTLYNTVVEDDFEAPFTIEPEGAGWNWVPWFVGGLLLLLAILAFVWRLIARRRKEEEKRKSYTSFS